MPHDHVSGPAGAPSDRAHAHGHNGADHALEHLRSHLSARDGSEDVQALAAQFIEGFAAATDKAAFLALSGVPLEIESETGGPPLKLVDVSVATQWQVAAASPAFGSRELSYLPFPGEMIRERVNCSFAYVSLTERRDLDLREFIARAKL